MFRGWRFARLFNAGAGDAGGGGGGAAAGAPAAGAPAPGNAAAGGEQAAAGAGAPAAGDAQQQQQGDDQRAGGVEALRADLAREREKAKGLEQRLAAIEQERLEQQRAGMSETERLKLERDEARTRLQDLEQRQARTDAISLAMEKLGSNFTLPADALADVRASVGLMAVNDQLQGAVERLVMRMRVPVAQPGTGIQQPPGAAGSGPSAGAQPAPNHAAARAEARKKWTGG